MRLQPKVKDGYTWRYPQGKAHLFARPPSKHSVGAYMELCRSISDKSVEAVAQPEFADAPSRSSGRIFYSRLPGDFPAEHTPRDDHSIAIGKLDAKINEIQTENEKLLVDLEQSQEAAQSKRLLYCQAESRIQQLELELSTLHAEHMQLASTNDQLNKRIEQSDDDLKKLWSVVYSLGPGR